MQSAADRLAKIASERGVSEEDVAQDALDALLKFPVVEGRAVVDRESGTSKLAASVNAWLGGGERPEDAKRAVRQRLLMESGVAAKDAPAHLAGVIALIGKRRQAPKVVERWNLIRRAVDARQRGAES